MLEFKGAIVYVPRMSQTLEKRVEDLDKKLAELIGETTRSTRKKDWRRTIGIFKDDPDVEEAVRLRGRGVDITEPVADDEGVALEDADCLVGHSGGLRQLRVVFQSSHRCVCVGMVEGVQRALTRNGQLEGLTGAVVDDLHDDFTGGRAPVEGLYA